MTEDKIGTLTGWKRIAAYFDVHASTAQRWHKKRKMPLVITPGGQPSAFPEDLKRYLKETK